MRFLQTCLPPYITLETASNKALEGWGSGMHRPAAIFRETGNRDMSADAQGIEVGNKNTAYSVVKCLSE